ncbi:MAG: hypothetical protein HOQ18_18355 [Dermatophilaceae bacterium]|nr:hypothetical protein [Dermatophilaceae bacterium]NUO92764.1 hypothetical protein [Dermatophilaceae bacterium]NUR16689.1 hypothetical protein [Dermatophilaceae bacterium]
MTRQGRYDDTALDGYGIADVDRPQRRVPIDLAAIAEWNAANEAARADYYARTAGLPDTYARRIAASERQLRYRARKEKK